MKLLFIACYSPLINNSAAIETLQYLNKLSDIDGNEIHLLTVNFPKNSVYYDETLLSMMNKKIKLHVVEGGAIFNRLMPKKKNNSNNVSNNKKHENIKKILRKIKNAIVIPDMYYGWAKNAAKYGVQLIKDTNIDIIFSMHEPPSSHLCAYYIKKKYKDIPWVTYWSDPWIKDSTREKSFVLKKIIEKKMEKNIIYYADKYIFVTEDNRTEYLNDYKKLNNDNTFIVNRGFDSKLYQELSKEKSPQFVDKNKINIIYTGEIFSKLRNIRPFIEAVEKIKEENYLKYRKLNILFFGNIDDLEGRKKLEQLEVVRVSPRIPFNEALKYMLNGNILLLFGNKNSKQIPAKIYDYFGAQGRIFVIYGDENDPIEKITKNNNKCICTYNSSENIKNNIYNMIEMYEKNKLSCDPDYNYEWSSVVNKLNKILEGCD